MTGQSGSYVLVAVFCAALVLVSPLWAYQNPATPAAGGSAPAQSDSVPVFHATTRLVLVDVSVSDKKGNFVPGLKAADFAVLEDGKSQRISAFATHRYETPQPVPPLQLPAHIYTNFAEQGPGGAVTVVLLDALNTPVSQQAYARKGMLQFLQKLPPGQRVALFVLTDRPKLVQGFTGSSDVLIAAANTVRPAHTPPLTTQEDNLTDSMIGPAVQSIQGAFTAQSVMQAEMRTRLTLASLNMLARALSGYSGRKNLLWLSGQFPFRLGPDFTMNTHDGLLGLYIHEVLETAALLAASQVSVYPIDVTGVEGMGIDISQPSGPDVQHSVATRWDKQGAMEDIARETGGKAFYGTNAVNEAMLHGLQQGSDYYTLAYTPENRDWNGRYRKIEVKIPVKGAALTYRRGYYAIAEKEFTGDEAARLLATAEQPTVPGSTMLLLKVQVLPPDNEHKTVRIDYAVDAHDFSFSETPDQHKHAAIDFMAVAWDKDFKDAGYVTSPIDADLTPESYQQMLQTGFPAHQELELKRGTYSLRLGVIDRGSRKVGTVDVPLTIGGNETATK